MNAPERLVERLSYAPETGEFTWLQRTGGQCKVGAEAGSVSRLGYRVITIDRIPYGAHRLAFLFMTGSIPTMVDHINGNKSDNRWTNLRPADHRLNGENQRQAQRHTLGRLLGVARHKGGRWQAQIKACGKTHYLGLHATAEDAHNAYLVAKRRLHAGCTI